MLIIQCGAREAFAQAAAPKPSVSIAPKKAPAAPPVPAESATPTTVTTEGTTEAPTEVPAATPPPSGEPPAPASAPANTQPTVPSAELVAQWQTVYERGKAALAAGSFPLASRMLNDVAMRAPDPALRAQARELGHLASYWTYNRLRLMPNTNTLPPDGKTPASLEDKRSIDELAILYGNTLIWGASFGVVVGFASDNADASTFFLPAIGMSALGAGALAFMDVKFGPLPYGVPQSITSGMYMGGVAGIYMCGILAGANLNIHEDKVFPGLVWGSMTAGALVGGLVGSTVPITPGRASFTSSGVIWGGLLASLVTVGISDGEFSSAPFVSGLIGATAGGVTTGLLGGMVSPSIARVRFIDVGGFAGGLAIGGLYASLSDRIDGQSLTFLTSAGIVAGLATASWLTKDMDPDEPRRGNLRKSPESRVMPFMTPQQGGGTMGFMGTF